jgi:hypothetical protein
VGGGGKVPRVQGVGRVERARVFELDHGSVELAELEQTNAQAGSALGIFGVLADESTEERAGRLRVALFEPALPLLERARLKPGAARVRLYVAGRLRLLLEQGRHVLHGALGR